MACVDGDDRERVEQMRVLPATKGRAHIPWGDTSGKRVAPPPYPSRRSVSSFSTESRLAGEQKGKGKEAITIVSNNLYCLKNLRRV